MEPRHPGRVSQKAMEYLKEVVDYGFGQSKGPGMRGRFENAFAKRHGVEFGIALCNGTATMHSCLGAVGVEPGDEVIVPPLTAAATAFAVLHQGAIPVFADIDPETFNIDPKSIRERITPRTKAIIPVHLYGLPANMPEIMAIAKEHNLTVIEDSAECFLSEIDGKLVGTMGHFGSFSFQSSKHLTCGDGGIVICNDPDLATGVRKFSCFGYHTLTGKAGGVIPKKQRCDPDSIRHDFLGWNYRMSDLQAAVALEQTERIDEIVAKRIEIGRMFEEVVKDCPFLISQKTPEGYKHSYWTFVCKFEEDLAGVSWRDFREKFYSYGGDLVYGAWRLSYNEPIFQDRRFFGKSGKFPVDSSIYEGGKYTSYEPGLCPVAEEIQPKLMQFKTNYVNLEDAKAQVEALRKAIAEVMSENA